MSTYAESHYIYNGTCPSKAAYDVYQLYIKTADGYCRDELQEEDDGTYIIFTRVDLDDWFTYHYDLRFQKINGRIVKSTFKTAKEIRQENFYKSQHKSLAVSDSSLADSDIEDYSEEFSDHGGEEYDDLYCYEKIN